MPNQHCGKITDTRTNNCKKHASIILVIQLRIFTNASTKFFSLRRLYINYYASFPDSKENMLCLSPFRYDLQYKLTKETTTAGKCQCTSLL